MEEFGEFICGSEEMVWGMGVVCRFVCGRQRTGWDRWWGAIGVIARCVGRRAMQRLFIAGGAFGFEVIRVNGVITCEGRGDVLTSFQDVFGEKSVEGGEEGSIAVEDHVNTRSRGYRGLADSRDDGGENGSEAGEGVGEVNMGEKGVGGWRGMRAGRWWGMA